MKKNLFIAAIILGLGTATFYFENKPLKLESIELNSEAKTTADNYINHQVNKIQNSFEKIELEKLKQYEVDGFWCTAQQKARTGVAHDYKDKIDDLLAKGAADPINHYPPVFGKLPPEIKI